jgi:hypothetical protein
MIHDVVNEWQKNHALAFYWLTTKSTISCDNPIHEMIQQQKHHFQSIVRGPSSLNDSLLWQIYSFTATVQKHKQCHFTRWNKICDSLLELSQVSEYACLDVYVWLSHIFHQISLVFSPHYSNESYYLNNIW